MKTSGKGRRIYQSGIYFDGEKVIYRGFDDDKHSVSKGSDPLAFVVPWQLSANQEDLMRF